LYRTELASKFLKYRLGIPSDEIYGEFDQICCLVTAPFSSGSEAEEPPDTASKHVYAHSEVCLRLLTFLDSTSNAATTHAWNLLAGSLHVLLRAGEAARQAAWAAFDPERRQKWWFATHAHLAAREQPAREPRCLAKQLTVFDLLVGPAHPLSRQLEVLLNGCVSGDNGRAGKE